MEHSITRSAVFGEHVAMQFRLYSGLFFDLPYENVNTAGTTMPLFAQFCREELANRTAPDEIVQRFFVEKLGVSDPEEIKDRLFAMLRLIERQVVLFDAIEDATYTQTRDVDGAGSLREALARVADEGLEDKLRALLPQFGVRIVLTAHPTQFYTDNVLGILAELRETIHRNDVQGVHRLLLQLGRTRFKKRERPSPYDEARSVLWFVDNVLYDVIPEIHGRVVSAAGRTHEEIVAAKPTIELGFWPGGDRDGNPNVSAAITRRVGNLLHDSLVARYLIDIAKLQQRLTFDGVIERLDKIRERLAARVTPKLDLQRSIDTGLYCIDPDNDAYADADQLIADLVGVRELLIKHHAGLFAEELDAMVFKVRSFGFAFASLDLRQDSRIISKLVDTALTKITGSAVGSYTAKSPDERLKFLLALDESKLAGRASEVLAGLEDPVLRDGLEVFAAAREIQQLNGERGLHRFIISNTQNTANILEVRLLAVIGGWSAEKLTLDIVPLFETVEDLEEAKGIMTELWSLPVYKKHLEQRNKHQHIMLGFSDGTKDGGYVTANWFIYKAKQSLSGLANQLGLQVVFFDGRGGPPARGGGNTHKFYRSLGPDIESRVIHLTVQGQTISSMYGYAESARHNVEQLVSAVLENNLAPHVEWNVSEEDAALLEELSGYALKRYLHLKDHKDFLRFIQDISPLQFYGQANISSRPTKRSAGTDLKLEDLRAIPFVGAWSQLKLNISGYYGLGSALKIIVDQGRLPELQAFYRRSLFFRTLLENSMQSLSKVYLPLTSYLEKDRELGDIRTLIGEEVETTKELLLEVSGQPELLGTDPVTRDSIRMREDLLIPALVMQQYGLLQIRKGKIKDEAQGETIKKLIIKSMATCVNASRNSV